MKARWWIISVLGDTRLTADARALLTWLGTRPAGWRYSVEEPQRILGFGRQKYQKVLRELKALGYVETSYRRNRLNRITATLLDVRDHPKPEGRKSSLRNASAGGMISRPPALGLKTNLVLDSKGRATSAGEVERPSHDEREPIEHERIVAFRRRA